MYLHFSQRLKERYGLDITPLEYIDLISSHYDTIEREIGTGRKIIKIKFKGVVIKAVKQSKGNKFLVTALPNK